LAKLAEAELVYARGIAPDATYTFKHALIQDAAYEALLKTRRRELHRKIAQTITEEFVEVAEAHPEVLARHWTEAGEIETAIEAWERAGKAAEVRNAFVEALENYERAVSLISVLPESPERDLRELELRQSAFVVLRLTKGFSAPEVIGAAERAEALAEKSGNLAQLADWVRSRCLPALIAGDVPSAATFADQALELALREGAPTRLAHVYTLQMLTHYHGGDFAGAEEAFTAGLKFFDDPDFRQSPRGGTVVAFGIASWNAWVLGRNCPPARSANAGSREREQAAERRVRRAECSLSPGMAARIQESRSVCRRSNRDIGEASNSLFCRALEMYSGAREGAARKGD
jgi:tetratricopeptide (TPR) repeat protein